MESAIYEGVVRHARRSPIRHEFRQRLALLYLDLDELDRVARVSRLLGIERLALASFRGADHLAGSGGALESRLRDRVEAELGRRPTGPIRVLTQPRVLGHVFNPLTLWFCHASDGRALEAVVAEVTNTPWLERHCYVLDVANAPRRHAAHEVRAAKRMHVSPFLDMDHEYVFRIRTPGRRLALQIANEQRGRRVFSASLALERRELTPGALRRNLATGALAPARAVAGIHWQALRLWMRGAPFHAHPSHAAAAAQEGAA